MSSPCTIHASLQIAGKILLVIAWSDGIDQGVTSVSRAAIYNSKLNVDELQKIKNMHAVYNYILFISNDVYLVIIPIQKLDFVSTFSVVSIRNQFLSQWLFIGNYILLQTVIWNCYVLINTGSLSSLLTRINFQ